MPIATSTRSRFLTYLTPSLVSPLVSFLMVPVVTYYLTPADFGLFALMSSMTAFCSSACSLGLSFLWSYNYSQKLEENERLSMTTSLSLIGFCAAAAGAVLFYFLLPFIAKWVGLDLSANAALFPILAAIAGLNALWMQNSDLLILEHRATTFSSVVISATLLSAISNLVGLSVLKWGIHALFISMLVTSIVYGIGSYIAVRPNIRIGLFSWRWLGQIIKNGFPSTVTSFLESFLGVAEKSALSYCSNVAVVGILAHSQSYRALLHTALKAVSRTIWPVSLREANGDGRFRKTEAVWYVVIVGLAVGGIFSSIAGRELIGMLTHQRFVDAAPLVTFWFVYCIVQCVGREDLAILYAKGRSARLATIMVVSQGFGMLALFPAVAYMGIWGVVVTSVSQNILLRVILYYVTKREPFQCSTDGVALLALLVVTGAGLLQMLFADYLIIRIGIGVACLIMLFAITWKTLKTMWKEAIEINDLDQR